jgi:hypothetical protein
MDPGYGRFDVLPSQHRPALLRVERRGDGAALLDGEVVVAEGRPATVEIGTAGSGGCCSAG